MEKVVPSAVTKGLKWGAENVASILNNLHLAEIVPRSVHIFNGETRRFSAVHYKNELKMITYLGALLGGMIGIVQGLLLLFLK